MQSCLGSGPPVLVLEQAGLSPDFLRTNSNLHVHVAGHLSETYAGNLSLTNIKTSLEMVYCRRLFDCMPVRKEELHICDVLDGGKACEPLHPGEPLAVHYELNLPLEMIRGTYVLNFRVDEGETNLACYSVNNVEVLASLTVNRVRDYFDAIVAFGMASSASFAIGSLFPTLTKGLFPQISGYLFIGIIVGPYCTNLVTHMHIFCIGGWINKVSLAFIGGAAGAEIFLPEFEAILPPMILQVISITIVTLVLVAGSLLALTDSGLLSIPAFAVQSGLGGRLALAMLSATLMTARSPASAIAVIAELQCSESVAAKMALGITVLSDIVVLVLFSLCSQVVRITTTGGTFGLMSACTAFMEILASVLLGALAAQLLRLVLSCEGPNESQKEGELEAPDEPMMTPELSGGSSKDVYFTDAGLVAVDTVDEPQRLWQTFRGVIVLFSLSVLFIIAEYCGDWTGGALRMEPLLACTVAASICGHDEQRRDVLLQSLGMWTRVVLLPFFTLAGASLELPGLARVFPAAVTLVLLRLLANFVGSYFAGLATRRFFPTVPFSDRMVWLTWSTLLAQAGVTMGLVLGIQADRAFRSWSQEFAILILGVVMLNQILGPVLCRIGMTAMIAEPGSLTQRCPSEESETDMKISWSNSTITEPKTHSLTGVYDGLWQRRPVQVHVHPRTSHSNLPPLSE